jgi:hypothetical protein
MDPIECPAFASISSSRGTFFIGGATSPSLFSTGASRRVFDGWSFSVNNNRPSILTILTFEAAFTTCLIHGLLTALMLLETAVLNKPDIRVKSFEYRATNPMIVDRGATVNGKWTSNVTAQLWCIDEQGVVGMTGKVTIE